MNSLSSSRTEEHFGCQNDQNTIWRAYPPDLIHDMSIAIMTSLVHLDLVFTIGLDPDNPAGMDDYIQAQMPVGW
jgi:hypothetical protein